MEALRGEQIVDAGTPEAAWQSSNFLARLPRHDVRQLLARTTRVVVVSPHPDDEVLGAGGLLAQASDLKVPILIVSVTDGEACYPGHGSWSPERLAQARRGELQQALHALGIEQPRVLALRFPDGRVSAHQAQLESLLVGILSAEDLVLAPWCRDGHPDHEATCRATRIACAATSARLLQFPVWGWHWVDASGAAFKGLDMSRLDLSKDLQLRKLEAINCFVTQIATDDPSIPDPILTRAILERFSRNFEVYIHGQ